MKRRILMLSLAILGMAGIAKAQNPVVPVPENGEKYQLHSGWIAHSNAGLNLDGNALTIRDFVTDGWIPATVPGTVLTTMLNNKMIPDPMFSMNNELIPDIYDTGNEHYTYWFVNKFDLDTKLKEGEHLRLNFRGINYKADIFLNGRRVNTKTHEGMFLRQSYDITEFIKADSTNILGVIVYPPTYPGRPGGQGGDAMIARNNTMQYTPGWDWIQPVRDRNTGIWDEVTITKSGSVTMHAPYIESDVPGVRQVEGKQKDAYIKASIELKNSSKKPVKGTLTYATDGQTFKVNVELAAKETKCVELDAITIKDPKLWWPNGVGEQPLSDISFAFNEDGYGISDKRDVTYGIRTLTTDKDPKTGGRRFWVNGQKVYVTGGNYINSDWMLRLSPERYDAEVRFHKEMNLRMIRVWGGALTERPEFYEACDKYGIMVYQDLWTSGDCNGAWQDIDKKESRERRMEYPDDHELYLKSAEDQIKMLRNHPSLALWCGGNEWPAAKDLDEALQEDIMPRLDPLRTFASFSTDTLFTRNTQGGVGDGPYGIQEHEWFYTVENASPFNPEAGSIGSAEVEGMRRIFTKEENDWAIKFFNGEERQAPIAWRYHKDLGYGDHLTRYGKIVDIETYCKYAQIINYDQYRYFMEGWASNMWSKYTGILIWKTQNPWSSMRGQMYDVYLDVNGALYGTRAGCKPLHAQYNIVTRQVQLPNTSLTSYTGLTVEAEVYDLNSKLLWSKKVDGVKSAANSVETLFAVEEPAGVEGVYFVNLILKDKSGKQIDENLYWISNKEMQHAAAAATGAHMGPPMRAGVSKAKDYSSLVAIPKAKADIKVDRAVSNGKHNYTVTIKAGSAISFFNRVKVFDKASGELILPVHYSENYVSVLPGRERTVEVEFSSDLKASDVEIVVESWTDSAVRL